MNRRIKARRKISRNFNQHKGKKQNVILAISVSAAVVMILLLSIVKIYSTVKNNRSGDGPNAQQVQATASPVPESVEAAAQPTPTPAPVIRDKAVALTFDDGPSRANDGRIVETLQKYGAHATFFVLGDRARVDGDILQMYLAAGCEIGSHSWNHPQLSKMKWTR